MKLLQQLWARLEPVFLRRKLERETNEELRFHLDMEIEKQLRAGFALREARRRAQLALGGLSRTQDAIRDVRGSNWLEYLPQDVRLAFRRLGRTPGFTAVAVLTLALGIGANTAIYSVVDGVLLRAMPFTDGRRLVLVWETDRRSGTTREPASWPDYLDYASRARSLSGSAALEGTELTLTPPAGEPARITGMAVTASYFPLTGVQPILGRLFTPEEDRPGGPNVTLLGEAFWRAHFGADPGVVGRTILLDDEPYLVVGVVPHGADFGLDQIHQRAAYHAPYVSAGDVGAWAPLRASEQTLPRFTHPVFMLGRLAPGVSLPAAERELAAIAAELEQTYHESNADRGVNPESLQEVVFGPTRPIMLMLLGAVALVLLVACANVANLLLARGSVRAREVAVRSTLGAGVGRLAAQHLTESLVLALLGGAAGVGLAVLGLKLLVSFAPADIPRIEEVGLNLRVLLVTLAVSGMTGLAFGLVPTIQAWHVDLMRTIRGETPHGTESPRTRRFRQGLVVAELALSVTLVITAGLLLRSLWSVLLVDPGFEAEGVVKAEFQLPPTRYPQDFHRWPAWPETHDFDRRLLEQVRAIPGVTSAALANAHPLDRGFTNSWAVVGRESEAADWPEISVRIVSPDYFATLGVRLSDGRDFTEGDDRMAPPVGIINQATARRFFAGRDPLGQQIRFWGVARTIVGVVADERIHGLTEAAPVAVYLPIGQAPRPGVVFARVTGDPGAAVAALRRAVLSADPGLAVYGAEPLALTLQQSQSQRRFATLLIGGFAAVTFLLALVGIHGVLSYTTSQRTREIGIRMALGATRWEVAGLVLGNGLRLALIGTGLGLLGAGLGSRLLGRQLYGITGLDPLTFSAVALISVAAALLAVWLPARRASRVAPGWCLRVE